MPLDRRKFLRHSVSIPAKLSINSGEYYSVDILNISIQGMQVKVDAWLIQQSITNIRQVSPSQPVDACVNFEVSLKKDTHQEISIDCHIIRLNRRSENIYYINLRYHDPDDATSSQLESFLEQFD